MKTKASSSQANEKVQADIGAGSEDPALPLCLEVGYKSIDVVPLTEAESLRDEVNGDFGYDESLMRVNVERKYREIVNTLIHETLHAIWGAASLKKKDGEERIVTQMANGLTEVLIRNPDFAAFISSNKIRE